MKAVIVKEDHGACCRGISVETYCCTRGHSKGEMERRRLSLRMIGRVAYVCVFDNAGSLPCNLVSVSREGFVLWLLGRGTAATQTIAGICLALIHRNRPQTPTWSVVSCPGARRNAHEIQTGLDALETATIYA